LSAKEVRDLIFQVITSWQVIVVTVALVLYCFLINAVARLHGNPRIKIPPVSKKRASGPSPGPSSQQDEAAGEDEFKDELGIIEE
jgi:hypothetical protein